MNIVNSGGCSRYMLLFCIICVVFASSQALSQGQRKEASMIQPTFYRTIQIDGLSIFYREAGKKDAPTILFLHGVPSSSRMFEPLFSRLADRYHGGPVGFRMALLHPDRINALIVQDAVAHNEGLGANWKTRRAFWADRGPNESALRTNLLSLPTTRTRHVGKRSECGALRPRSVD